MKEFNIVISCDTEGELKKVKNFCKENNFYSNENLLWCAVYQEYKLQNEDDNERNSEEYLTRLTNKTVYDCGWEQFNEMLYDIDNEFFNTTWNKRK